MQLLASLETHFVEHMKGRNCDGTDHTKARRLASPITITISKRIGDIP
jgi:hypothetical protein